MGQEPLSDARLIKILQIYEKAGSSSKAAAILGLSAVTIRHHVLSAKARGLTVNSTPQPSNPIEIRRLHDRISHETAARKEAERHAAYEKTIREAVFGLAAEPLRPPHWIAKTPSGKEVAEAAILMISDVHRGEKISLDEMGGMNSYNDKISRARLERLFSSVIKLLTRHSYSKVPEVIYIPLLGDLISGEIHDELSKSNDMLSIPAVRAISEDLIAGLTLLLKELPRIKIEVISVPGNHGRTTKKPEHKGFSVNSYDTLVAWTIEAWFRARGESRISFSAPASGDAIIKIHGWTFLITHGDRIGSRGGMGFVGPVATIARGFQKLAMEYAAQGTIIDFILVGHFHTSAELPQGFANGSVPGPSEFARSSRMRPEPASQWLLTVHPRYGIARRWKVLVGDHTEGSIYRGRA